MSGSGGVLRLDLERLPVCLRSFGGVFLRLLQRPETYVGFGELWINLTGSFEKRLLLEAHFPQQTQRLCVIRRLIEDSPERLFGAVQISLLKQRSSRAVRVGGGRRRRPAVNSRGPGRRWSFHLGPGNNRAKTEKKEQGHGNMHGSGFRIVFDASHVAHPIPRYPSQPRHCPLTPHGIVSCRGYFRYG